MYISSPEEEECGDLLTVLYFIRKAEANMLVKDLGGFQRKSTEVLQGILLKSYRKRNV